MAGHHIEEGVAAIAEKTNEPKLAHPITLFRMAYGLPD
jgi:hypothetical protein